MGNKPNTKNNEETKFQYKETIRIPFYGFYESIHGEQTVKYIEDEIEYVKEKLEENNSVHLLTEELEQEAMEFAYDSDFNREYRAELSKEYAKWFVSTILDDDDSDENLSFELYSPRQYNYSTDTISINTVKPLKNLNLEYFKEHDLMGDLMAVIKENYSSRSGFVSFVDNQPSEDKLFTEEPYLASALLVLACHNLNIPVDELSLGKITEEFYLYDESNYVYDKAINNALSNIENNQPLLSLHNLVEQSENNQLKNTSSSLSMR